MAKTKSAFVCTECGSDHSKWQGQCGDCGAWNTLAELRLGSKAQAGSRKVGYAGVKAAISTLDTIALEEAARIETGLAEFDRVLGGGLVRGSATLLGGQPGAGKSTLLLQVVGQLSSKHDTLYVTGEESLQQVALRARRLGVQADALQLMAETSVESLLEAASVSAPKILVIDSIQVMHTDSLQAAPGSVSQVRECAAMITRFAKQTDTIVLLVGHVTKDGAIAGPKVLEHMIDCSLMLEGAADNRFRTLRGHKNRFGPANELGVFAMTGQGMREVRNPSAIFLSGAATDSPGSAIAVLWEGTRALLVEIQALVDDSQMSNPRRVAVGLEQNRLAMLLAVLHRHGNVAIGSSDVFANAVGGVKVLETGVDLALLLAVVSSFRNKSLPKDLVVFGEVGLSGEIRPVSSGQERISEAAKHGFKRAIAPAANKPKQPLPGMQVHAVRWLREALDLIEQGV